MKAFIQLGKIGDILSILPILRKEDKPVLVVAKEFAHVLEGVSYVDPVIWKGSADDVAGAVLFAKKRFSQVVVLQTWGNIPIQFSTPSFQFDQWRRAGTLEHFDDWALIFDRRDEARETSLIPTIEKYIVFADHSQSSPFFHKQELAEMLKVSFPEYAIIRLSEIRAERIYDLLGLFNKAAALVTIETAHLHLSRASNVPTFALATNGWRGSAYSRRFKFFMRYTEWDLRKHHLIEAMKASFSGQVDFKPVQVIPTGGHNGYNLSKIGEDYTYRVHTEGTWKTKLFLNDKPLHLPERYSDFSAEDCRLFWFKGKLHGAYTVSAAIDGQFRCYIAYGEIHGQEIEHIQIHHAENNLLGMTKNYVPFEHEGSLHFIYGIKGTNQIVLQVDRDKVSTEYKSPAPTWGFGEIRGGCIMAHNGNLLRFFHSRQDYGDKTIRYFIGASILEAKPPFKTIAVSQKPILEGNEAYTPNVRHWKANVVFPLGVTKVGDKFLLSYGRNDCECCLAELTEKDLNL